MAIIWKHLEVYGSTRETSNLQAIVAILLMFLMILIVLPFKSKQKVTGQTGNNVTKDVQIMVPLKYLSNFWRILEMQLINCKKFFFNLV